MSCSRIHNCTSALFACNHTICDCNKLKSAWSTDVEWPDFTILVSTWVMKEQ